MVTRLGGGVTLRSSSATVSTKAISAVPCDRQAKKGLQLRKSAALLLTLGTAIILMLQSNAAAFAIVDGEPIERNEQNLREFGAVGRVQVYYENGTVGTCTATLIAPSVAMTAQHCMPFKNDQWDDGESPSEIFIEVTFGMLNHNDDIGVTAQVVAGTESNRDYGTVNDSIFLLHLDSPITEIAPIRAAGHDEGRLWKKGRDVFQLGWGSVRHDESVLSAELRRADTTVGDTVATFGAALKAGGMLRVSDGGRGVASGGDSGGPLLARDDEDNDRLVVVGVLWGGNTDENFYMKPGVDSLFDDDGNLKPNPRRVT